MANDLRITRCDYEAIEAGREALRFLKAFHIEPNPGDWLESAAQRKWKDALRYHFTMYQIQEPIEKAQKEIQMIWRQHGYVNRGSKEYDRLIQCRNTIMVSLYIYAGIFNAVEEPNDEAPRQITVISREALVA